MKKKSLKTQKYKKYGDRLDVKLTDNSYHPIYQKEVEVNKIKEVAQLLSDLKDKGVPIEKARDWSIENLNWW